MSLLTGARLGSYEIVGPLGAGGMGDVYRARDLTLGREVAIKVLPDQFGNDAERLARFEREARALASLNHPNIAAIYGVEQHGLAQAIVMELVPGDDLSEHLRRGPLALPEAIAIARQIADALDAAHEKGIVHRDLKPANIKITPDGFVKVLDFGLAKAVAGRASGEDDSDASTQLPATREGQIVGTVAYMSPEQVRGQPVDRRTDIWAFGCVLFEMMAGRRAFFRETSSDTIAAVLGAEVDWTSLPDDVPPVLRRLLERCLDKSLKRRLRDIGDARPDLEDALLPVAPVPVHSTGPGVSRRRLVFGGAALGMLGVGFVGGSVVAGRRSGAATPSYQRLTFRRGLIRTARFAPDFKTILCGALWDGDVCRIYTVRPDSPESAPLNLPPATPLAISASGELALTLGTHFRGTMTYGTLARVPLSGGAPREMLEDVKFADWSPDGRDLAIVRRIGDRDQLEFPIGTVVAESSTPKGGFSFARVSPGGDFVAAFELEAAEGLTGTVTIVDRSGKRRTTSRRYVNVFGLAWNGTGSEVLFTAADELPLFRNTLYAMRPGGDVRVLARMPGNASLHDVAPDGRILIARTDDRGGISVLAPGEPAERDLSWLDAPVLADISPDGRSILFSETGVGGGSKEGTYLRGSNGSAPVRLADGRAQALSPDGRWAIARTGSPHLDLIPTGAGPARRLERLGLMLLRARFLPDSRRVVVHAQPAAGGPRLFVIDREGTAVDAITPDGVEVGASAWAVSPDGTAVAVARNGVLEFYPLTAGSPRRVPGVTDRESLIGWIEDGLLVSEASGAAGKVFRVDPSSGRRVDWKEIVLKDPTGIMHLHLSRMVVTPDGQHYGYSWHRAISDLYLVDGWT